MVELRLLRCTPSPPSTSPPTTPPPLVHLLGVAAASPIDAVKDGDYEAVLAAAASHLLLASASFGLPNSATQFVRKIGRFRYILVPNISNNSMT